VVTGVAVVCIDLAIMAAIFVLAVSSWATLWIGAVVMIEFLALVRGRTR
jgi:hypothetical protein